MLSALKETNLLHTTMEYIVCLWMTAVLVEYGRNYHVRLQLPHSRDCCIANLASITVYWYCMKLYVSCTYTGECLLLRPNAPPPNPHTSWHAAHTHVISGCYKKFENPGNLQSI